MTRALLALILLTGCEQITSTTHIVDRQDGTGGTATTVEIRAPTRDFGMVEAPGTDGGRGFNEPPHG